MSCDSMQVYRRMDIGTAKPTAEEMRGIPHHMIDVADPEEDYSAERYRREAIPVVDDILARGKLPILVGGHGALSGRPAQRPRFCGQEHRLARQAPGPI